MATVNLLTSSFNGKLGAHYGVSQYNKKYVKAVPFSHSPHNAIQNKSVRAFEVLNRISAIISKSFFPFLPLSTRKMSKINAVASFLKPTVKNHKFDAYSLIDVFGDKQSFSVESFYLDEDNSFYFFDIKNLENELTYSDSAFFIGIFNELGYCKGYTVEHANSFSLRLPVDLSVGGADTIIILRCVKRNNKYIPLGCFSDVDEGKIISLGVVYCERFPFPNDFSLVNGIWGITELNFSDLSDGILYINA